MHQDEQIRPDDPFGRTMMKNISSRGCELYGLVAHPTIESQENRFLDRGWSHARCWDMNAVYSKYIPEEDRIIPASRVILSASTTNRAQKRKKRIEEKRKAMLEKKQQRQSERQKDKHIKDLWADDGEWKQKTWAT